ncbi:MAG: NAD(P)H-binding protein [Candidatus Magnetomorum sp.]|nr:NAD(P)H-binding protein [Candidatus Magnetomorum sp.]
MKTAIVIGASGLVGSNLVSLLLDDHRFEKIVIFTRRPSLINHKKLKEHVIQFDSSEAFIPYVKGDVLFSALGTTIKAAGSQANQYLVDYTYQYQFAKAASDNGVQNFVLVSAAHASPDAYFFYSRMKGELERDICRLNFAHIRILKPGLLCGERSQKRPGEWIGFMALTSINRIGLFRRYRPIHGKTVARAMINANFLNEKAHQVFELDRLFSLAANH